MIEDDEVWGFYDQVGSQMAGSMERLFSNTPVSPGEREKIQSALSLLEEKSTVKLIRLISQEDLQEREVG